MKVLQIYNRPLGAGGEEVVVQKIEELAGVSGEVSTLYLNSSDWTGPQAPPKWKQAAWTIYNPQSARVLRQKQQQVRADAWLFHGTYPVGSPSLYHEALREKIPVIQFIHNFRPFSVNSYLWANGQLAINRPNQTYLREIKSGSWQNSKLKTAILATSLFSLRKLNWLRAVKAWIATTDFMRDKFVEAGVPVSDVFVLRQMWTPSALPSTNPEANHFLFLGRLIEEKGVKVLCEAWDIVRHRLGASAPRLIIAGSGPLDQWIRQQAKENPLITFDGPVSGEQKNQLIASCRAMVAPSIWWEPLGLVTYEAYNFGKPMLATRSGGFTETIVDGLTGMLHEPGNAEALADQVIQINASPERRRSMGENGRQWLLSQPTPAQWLETFKKIVTYAKRPS